MFKKRYNDIGFRGFILYGIQEVVDPKTGEFIEYNRYPVAVFTTEQKAKEYVENARLASPQGGGNLPRVAFKKSSLLNGCLDYLIGPCPNVKDLEVDPVYQGRGSTNNEAKEKTSPLKVRKRRKRSTKEQASSEKEAKPKRKRGRPRKVKEDA